MDRRLPPAYLLVNPLLNAVPLVLAIIFCPHHIQSSIFRGFRRQRSRFHLFHFKEGCCHGDNTIRFLFFFQARLPFALLTGCVSPFTGLTHSERFLRPVSYFPSARRRAGGVPGGPARLHTRANNTTPHLFPPGTTPPCPITCGKHHFHHPLRDAAAVNHCLPPPRHRPPPP